MVLYGRFFSLEKLRQEIQFYLTESGSLSDYIDRGRPSKDQQLKAEKDIQQLESEARNLQRKLSKSLKILRKDNPQVVQDWAEWHISICQQIVNQGANSKDGLKEMNRSVRKYVAGKTLLERQEVKDGKRDYVHINNYFLADYWEEVSNFLK